jgi:hypothetical protein
VPRTYGPYLAILALGLLDNLDDLAQSGWAKDAQRKRLLVANAIAPLLASSACAHVSPLDVLGRSLHQMTGVRRDAIRTLSEVKLTKDHSYYCEACLFQAQSID